MRITKKQLKRILLKEFKEIEKETSSLELSVLLADISSEIDSNYDDTQSFLEQQFSSNKKNLNESLREHFLKEEESKDLNFSFKTRISDNLIKVFIEKNDEKINVKIEPDDVMRKLGPNPSVALALSYLKMKDLEGYDDSESKTLFKKISEFVKELDQSIKVEDPEDVLDVLEGKKIGIINPIIEKIKDIFSGNKDLII